MDADPKNEPLTVYDITSDEMVPLTQERLDRLLKIELAYGRMIQGLKELKRLHTANVIGWGGSPSTWD